MDSPDDRLGLLEPLRVRVALIEYLERLGLRVAVAEAVVEAVGKDGPNGLIFRRTFFGHGTPGWVRPRHASGHGVWLSVSGLA